MDDLSKRGGERSCAHHAYIAHIGVDSRKITAVFSCCSGARASFFVQRFRVAVCVWLRERERKGGRRRSLKNTQHIAHLDSPSLLDREEEDAPFAFRAGISGAARSCSELFAPRRMEDEHR